MRFMCEREAALRGVRLVQNILTSSALPILSQILFSADQDRVELIATNLETTIRVMFEASIEESGSICVPGEKIHSILRELPGGRLRVRTEQNRLVLTMGEISFTVMGIAADEFPEVPQEPETTLTISKSSFQEILNKTAFSAGQDEVRQNLNCILLAGSKSEDSSEGVSLRAVATDGRRLSLLLMSGVYPGKPFEVLMPLKAARQLMRILEGDGDLKVGIEEKRMSVKTGAFIFFSQLVDAKFPDYEGVIPDDTKVAFEVKTSDLMGAIRRVSLLSEQQTRLIRCRLDAGALKLSAAASGLGSAHETVPVKLHGSASSVEVGFNAGFLLDALRAMDSETTDIALSDQESPGVFKPTGSNRYVHVLMPVRLT